MTKIARATTLGALAIGISLSPGPARAQTCEESSAQNALHYVRRLSLDLRGRVPDIAELESVAANGAVDPAIIDLMLSSSEFVEQMRSYHRDLLWTNIVDQRLAPNTWRLRGPGRRYNGQPLPAYFIAAAARATRYRGGVVPCLDEPARFDPATGAILTTLDPIDPNIRREGWVDVAPYWDPTRTVRVCAFDAQANLTAIDDQGRTVDCSTSVNAKCGCGPNLRWCESPDDRTGVQVLSSMAEQLLRFTDDIVRNDRPYTDLLLAVDMEINGPISHWLRYQTRTAGGDALTSLPEQNHPVPQISFEETNTWQKVDRGLRHSGVLSMPGYLLKFQSNRGRAHRFYTAFLCREFEATNPLPPASDPCHREADLTKRCGCKDCHVAVEPAASHWGRWGEAGLLPLNEGGFPTFNGCCVTGGACPAEMRRSWNPTSCARFYFTERELSSPSDPSSAYLGMLRPYVFADAFREANIAAGPAGIAESAIQSGAFAACTVSKMWTRFLGRGPTAEEDVVLSDLTRGFQGDYNLRRLIQAIVTRPEYVGAKSRGTAE